MKRGLVVLEVILVISAVMGLAYITSTAIHKQTMRELKEKERIRLNRHDTKRRTIYNEGKATRHGSKELNTNSDF